MTDKTEAAIAAAIEKLKREAELAASFAALVKKLDEIDLDEDDH